MNQPPISTPIITCTSPYNLSPHGLCSFVSLKTLVQTYTLFLPYPSNKLLYQHRFHGLYYAKISFVHSSLFLSTIERCSFPAHSFALTISFIRPFLFSFSPDFWKNSSALAVGSPLTCQWKIVHCLACK